MHDWTRELDRSRGFVLVRGLPVERWSADDAALAYYGLGLHIGEPMSQNANGDLLGHVRDEDLPDPDHPSVRPLPHPQAAGLPRRRRRRHRPALPARRPPRRHRRIVSSVTLFNEVLRRRPDLVEVLFEPFWFYRNDEQRDRGRPSRCRSASASTQSKVCVTLDTYRRSRDRSPPLVVQLLGLRIGEARDLRR